MQKTAEKWRFRSGFDTKALDAFGRELSAEPKHIGAQLGFTCILADLLLEFIGFEQFEEAGFNDAYRQAYAGDEPLTDLDNWDVFETAHGGFIDMYLLWCRKPE